MNPSPPTAFHLRSASLQGQAAIILANIDLRIDAGERIALLGKSGAGKSTLLACLRQQRPDDCAWCPQHSALVPMLSVFHNIYMGSLDRHGSLYNLRNLIRPVAREWQAVSTLAGELGLVDKLRTSVDRLSGGEAQRTALGRSLFSQRAILLADEPVSAVDEQQAEQLLTLALARHQTAVLALHDQQLALRHCQRIIGLRAGRVVLDIRAEDCHPEHLQQVYQ